MTSSFDAGEARTHSKKVMQSLIDQGEGNLKTKRSYPFNIYADKWVLGASKRESILTDWLHDIRNIDLQIDIRRAMGKVFRKCKTAEQSNGYIRRYFEYSQGELDKKNIVAFVAHIRKIHKRDDAILSFKSLLAELQWVGDSYYPLYSYIDQNIVFRKYEVDIFDTSTGSLSDAEHEALNQALYDYVGRLKEGQYGNYKDPYNAWREFITLRLIRITTRRLVTLRQLKWCDISRSQSIAGSLDPVCYEIKMPMGKLRDTLYFRTTFEDAPFPIVVEFYKELILYRSFYFEKFKAHLKNCGVNLTIMQWKKVSPQLPVLPDYTLFTAKFKNVEEVLQSFNGEGFHCSTVLIADKSKRLFNRLNVQSDRVAKLKYSMNRQRHTLASRLGILGKCKQIIALALGQSTTQATGKYVDLDSSAIKHINKTTAEGFAPIVKAFQGNLIPKLTEELRAVEAFGTNGITNVGGCAKCSNCDKQQPFACYPCSTFRPLFDADHHSVFWEAKQQYERSMKAGVIESDLVGLKNCMKWIAYTIAACEKMASVSMKKK